MRKLMSRSGALSVEIESGNLSVLCNGSHLLQLTSRFLWMQRVARAF